MPTKKKIDAESLAEQFGLAQSDVEKIIDLRGSEDIEHILRIAGPEGIAKFREQKEIISELAEQPIYSSEELMSVTESFLIFLEKEASEPDCVRSGSPNQFELSNWLGLRLENTYEEASCDVDDHAEQIFGKNWEPKVETLREKVISLKIAVFRLILERIKSRDVTGIEDSCLQLIPRFLTGEEVRLCFGLDAATDSGKILDPNWLTIPLYPYVHGRGGLTDLIVVIGHYSSEMQLGTFANLRQSLKEVASLEDRLPFVDSTLAHKAIGRSLEQDKLGKRILPYVNFQSAANADHKRLREFWSAYLAKATVAISLAHEAEALMKRLFEVAIQHSNDLFRSTSPRSVLEFAHSPDYRSVCIRGKEHELTRQQAEVIRILHENYRNRTPALSQEFLLIKAGASKSEKQLAKVFRDNEKAFRDLVEPGQRKGHVKLKIFGK